MRRSLWWDVIPVIKSAATRGKEQTHPQAFQALQVRNRSSNLQNSIALIVTQVLIKPSERKVACDLDIGSGLACRERGDTVLSGKTK